MIHNRQTWYILGSWGNAPGATNPKAKIMQVEQCYVEEPCQLSALDYVEFLKIPLNPMEFRCMEIVR